jgi:hypothetical protein
MSLDNPENMNPNHEHHTISEPPQELNGDLTKTPPTGDPEIDELTPKPYYINGKYDFNPRNSNSYPSFKRPDKVTKLISPFNFDRSHKEKVLGEEITSQMGKTQGEHHPHIPPKPLTIHELKEHIQTAFPEPYSEITVWVSCEQEIINDLAVGEYRDYVEGYIIRFNVEVPHKDANLLQCELIPDYSPTGFSWYISPSTGPIKEDGILELAQSRRLEALFNAENPSEVLNPRDDIYTASQFLNSPLIGTEKTVVPAGWMTTQCEADPASELFHPRYKGTFVHDESGIVVEFSGLEPTEEDKNNTLEMAKGILPGMSGNQSTPHSTSPHKVDNSPLSNSEKQNEPTHEYELHFASEDIEQKVQSQFPKQTTGKEIHQLLQFTHELVC